VPDQLIQRVALVYAANPHTVLRIMGMHFLILLKPAFPKYYKQTFSEIRLEAV
jgi:hypothetical protein